jgi:hypothetical protein
MAQSRLSETSKYIYYMSKMIHLRNVPDGLHRSLARAAMAGMSLSDYLLAKIKEIAKVYYHLRST